MPLSVTIIPILRDNYSYLICDGDIKGVVDPGCAATILKYLGQDKLDYILNTHDHWDHTAGNEELRRVKGAKLICFEHEKHIANVDIAVEDSFMFGNYTVDVLPIPGHTFFHVAFFFRKDKILFCGDTLFYGGCGRVFTGDMEKMYNSLELLKNLPDETKVFCGHEYTAHNLRFALSVEPNNLDLQDEYKKIRKIRRKLKPTIPSTIKQEKLINPFFRASSVELRKSLNMEHSSNLAVFTKLRQMKDGF